MALQSSGSAMRMIHAPSALDHQKPPGLNHSSALKPAGNASSEELALDLGVELRQQASQPKPRHPNESAPAHQKTNPTAPATSARYLAPPNGSLLRAHGSFEEAELDALLHQPMSALPLGPDDADDDAFEHDEQNINLITPQVPISPEEERAQMLARIQKQVNFYYGDRNYPTDKFLRKHTKAHPDGWVPIATLAAYKKMKKLTQDIDLIAEALEDVDIVELSPDRLNVRRCAPPVKSDAASICSTTVVATGFDGTWIDLSRHLAHFGHIVRARRLQPEDPLPAEVHEVCPNEHLLPASLRQRTGPIWLVEYDYADEAMDAVIAMEGRRDLQIGVLYKKPRKKQIRLGTCPSPTALMMVSSGSRSQTASPVPRSRFNSTGPRRDGRDHSHDGAHNVPHLQQFVARQEDDFRRRAQSLESQQVRRPMPTDQRPRTQSTNARRYVPPHARGSESPTAHRRQPANAGSTWAPRHGPSALQRQAGPQAPIPARAPSPQGLALTSHRPTNNSAAPQSDGFALAPGHEITQQRRHSNWREVMTPEQLAALGTPI
ncbi:uncharacterized protein MONBRDRAFT_39206 [Monosiga brevicollis MX1]|uniref:HTH La-type RNA-binding domain-containing protein n=1 Tax=Monosiga brevicollis TaxID=81824 RepID=A9VCW7_MONBE|nr:uncharacterized protein MONBRDRAFT_39206 [Monosiga brevicollis MX1]EDQ84664.1 predicted protein [Monosiga brevicollis MX1]|eukprot:XP_001750568.1 hypothetical protein [Monosiga brevicollis MX1]